MQNKKIKNTFHSNNPYNPIPSNHDEIALNNFQYLEERLKKFLELSNIHYIPSEYIQIKDIWKDLAKIRHIASYLNSVNNFSNLYFLELEEIYSSLILKNMYTALHTNLSSYFQLKDTRIEIQNATIYNLLFKLHKDSASFQYLTLLDLTEHLLTSLSKCLIQNCNHSSFKFNLNLIEKLSRFKFVRITYSEALKILGCHTAQLKYFSTADYNKISEYFGHTPVFITNWPDYLVDFNAQKSHHDKSYFYELVFPIVGTVLSGKLNEHNSTRVLSNLQKSNIKHSLTALGISDDYITTFYLELLKHNNDLPVANIRFVFDKLYYLFMKQ